MYYLFIFALNSIHINNKIIQIKTHMETHIYHAVSVKFYSSETIYAEREWQLGVLLYIYFMK
jgi:hypothetical protein